MWGAAACALSASMLSHFSITRKVSSPHFFWNGSALSASTAAPYSMQPCSARTAARIRGGDERRGGGAFVADQLVEHRARLADAQHELAVGEDHVIGVAVGVDLLRSRYHNQGPQPTEANMPYTPVVPKGSAPRPAMRSTYPARWRSTDALHPGIDPRGARGGGRLAQGHRV